MIIFRGMNKLYYVNVTRAYQYKIILILELRTFLDYYVMVNYISLLILLDVDILRYSNSWGTFPSPVDDFWLKLTISSFDPNRIWASVSLLMLKERGTKTIHYLINSGLAASLKPASNIILGALGILLAKSTKASFSIVSFKTSKSLFEPLSLFSLSCFSLLILASLVIGFSILLIFFVTLVFEKVYKRL